MVGWEWLRTRGTGAAGATAGALLLALAAPIITSTWNGNPDVTGLAWVLAALWALLGTGVPLPWTLVESLAGFELLHQTACFVALAAIGLLALAAADAPRLWRWRWRVPIAVAADPLILGRGANQLSSVPVWDDGACAALTPLAHGPVFDLPPDAHELALVGALCHARPMGAAINRPLPPAVGVTLGPPGPNHSGSIVRAAVDAGFR